MRMRLREDTSDTWGGLLHAEIKANEKRREARWAHITGYSESLGRLKKEVQACIELLRKKRLTVAALLRETAGNVAYTADSVFMKVYTGFYVGAKEQEKLFTFAKAENFDIVKQSKRRALVNGSGTLLETVRIDNKFQLNFIDQKIIDSFPKRKNRIKCEHDGCAVPDQCVPIMYTREMHDRVKSFSNCCIIYIKGLYFTTRLVTKMSFLMTPPPLEQHAAKTRSAGKRGGELGVVSKIWAKKPAAEITDIPDPLLVD
jgi:hypothetical protein